MFVSGSWSRTETAFSFAMVSLGILDSVNSVVCINFESGQNFHFTNEWKLLAGCMFLLKSYSKSLCFENDSRETFAQRSPSSESPRSGEFSDSPFRLNTIPYDVNHCHQSLLFHYHHWLQCITTVLLTASTPLSLLPVSFPMVSLK